MQFPQPLQPNGRQIPTIGAQKAAVQQAVSQAASQLSLQIYAQLAVSFIRDRDEYKTADAGEQLQKLARDAQQAGTAFFEGIGVIPSDSGKTKPTEPA